VATMQKEQQPYARVGEDGPTYAGPTYASPTKEQSLPGDPARRVVLFGPDADRISASTEFQNALGEGPKETDRWQVLPVTTSSGTQDWGASTSALIDAIMEKHALSVIALDRNSAHLAEQLALKSFIPVIALSSDSALTSTNVPWIFRLPSGTSAASALRLIQAAAQESGGDRFRLREVLASGRELSGMAFQPSGAPLLP